MAFDCIWHYLISFDKTPAYSSQNKAVNLNLLELLSVSGFRLQPGVYGRLWVPLLQKWPKVADIFFHLEWTWSVQTSGTKLSWMFESWMILSKESLAIAGWNLHPVLQVWPCIVFVPSSQGNPHVVALDVYKKPFKRQDTVVTHDTWMLRMLLECHGSCTLDRITTALVARHNRKLWDVLRAIWIGRISYFTTYLSQGLGAARFNLWEGAGIQGRHIGIILESRGTSHNKNVLTLNSRFQDAASHYEKAWEFCNEASPAVGRNPSAFCRPWQLWSSSLLWL